MRSLRLVALLLSILVVDTAAQRGVSGSWRAVFVTPEQGMATFNDIVLVLKADGTTLNGTAEMADWPGLAPIADGKIDGDKFSFAWTGTRPSSAGYPHMKFTGSIDGDRIKPTLLTEWGPMEMQGQRLLSR